MMSVAIARLRARHAAAGSLFLADLTGSITLIAQQGRRASAVAGRRHNELVPFAYTPTRFGVRLFSLPSAQTARL
jgi:hypothetical protein